MERTQGLMSGLDVEHLLADRGVAPRDRTRVASESCLGRRLCIVDFRGDADECRAKC
jgi:hypothetical protein